MSALLILSLFFAGCAADRHLAEINREQHATIESLQNEVTRLNRELDRLSKIRQETAPEALSGPKTGESQEKNNEKIASRS